MTLQMPTKLVVNLDGDFNIRADGLGVVIELSKGYLFEYDIEYGIEYGNSKVMNGIEYGS